MIDTTVLEQAVLSYLNQEKKPVAIGKIVDEVVRTAGDPDPSDLKLAALRLVDSGRAEINRRWEFSISEAAGAGEAIAR
ncbi:hypothetical protein [Pseudomarimonas arenosa]|uniref:SMC-Scp complex subunit ScpB n=1 Tax=Pseudomarimonas arenosa TaxID=2774145 RepID=A0AAW3ZNZ7_9GAMM|nr:hypothetical protein [Pseudomarimonas arenosa]MBD8526364.1 hypothetical protein [Pseudomarimonas arenosa]